MTYIKGLSAMIVDGEKIDTELNLSLNLSDEERERSLDLNEGFNKESDEWELIIRYFGNLEDISSVIPFSYIELYNGYAVIIISQKNIGKLSENPEIIFIDKPKAVFFEELPSGYNYSCFNTLNFNGYNLNGKGVLIAVLDTGIDFRHPVFNEYGSTTLYEIWDQSIDGNPPYNLKTGSIYNQDDINKLINSNDNVVANDASGHGTAVASIIKRLAPASKLIIVKLSESSRNNSSRTTAIMLGITYAIKKSMELKLPLVINISFGNNYGDHEAGSILEKYIDSVSNISKISIVTGMGNEGTTSRHTSFNISNKSWHQEELFVSRFEQAINIQIWRRYIDLIDIFLVTPDGIEIGPFNIYQETMRYLINNMDIFVLNGFPTPLNKNQETFISIIPKYDYLQEGIWKIKFNPKTVSNGRVDIWLPVFASTSSELRFLRPSEFTTMTIPATAKNIISVAAYNQNTLTYAAFSGRGYSPDGSIKPDIAAPGVDINVAVPGNGYTNVSGTSFAAPFVSSAAAILMEYGITEGNDVFLYGAKLKEYLIKGAKKLPGSDLIPNEKTGWGVLCTSASLPV